MANEKPFNAGDAGSVSDRRTAAQKSRDSELADVKVVLGTEAGRRFLWRLLGYCGVYSACFTGNSTTFFNEGKREVGLTVLKELAAADQQAYVRMQMENMDND